MTQTPASGPEGPRTTPPISSLSIATAAGCACADENAAIAETVTRMAKRDRSELCRFMLLPINTPGLWPAFVGAQPTRTHRQHQRPASELVRNARRPISYRLLPAPYGAR